MAKTYDSKQFSALQRKALFIILGAAALRFLMAAILPLVPDELYYLDWSHSLSFGYYDHPPTVAWLIAFSRFLFSWLPAEFWDGRMHVRGVGIFVGIAVSYFSWHL